MDTSFVDVLGLGIGVLFWSFIGVLQFESVILVGVDFAGEVVEVTLAFLLRFFDVLKIEFLSKCWRLN